MTQFHATPRRAPAAILDALQALKGRLRRRFFVHGLGWIVAAVASLLLAHYALDRLLVLPVPVRMILLIGIVTYLVQGLRRRILYPVRRPLGEDDMALLVERGYPLLEQELISAVQLDADHPRGDSPQMIAEVQTRAAADIRALDLGRLIRPQRTLRVWSIAAGVLVLLGGAGLLSPEGFGIWAGRLFGSSAPYPRKTFLTIEVPEGQGNYRVETPDSDGPIRVSLARGSDLPINVLVGGSVPPIVDLQITPIERTGDHRRVGMSRRGPDRFRHVLRRLLHPVRIQAIGGDDPGTRPVEVEILVPPAVTGLSVAVEPPPYTGLEIRRRDGGLVEALPGSKVIVSFHSTEPLNEAWLDLQESGRRLPALAEEANAAPESGGELPGPRYVARFDMPDKADRYRIHLSATNGLKELSPGVHSLIPTPDLKPRLQVLTPGPSLQALTPQSAFPLRLVVSDDYGLTRIGLEAQIGAQGPAQTLELWPEAETQPPTTKEHGLLRMFRPADLLKAADREPREGDRLSFVVYAEDNRQPKAQRGTVQAIRIDLLDAEELRRRLQSRLRGTRRTVERALKVQREQEARVETFLAEASEGSGSTEARRQLGLAAAEAGQQRVRGFILQIRGDLGEVLDSHVFNGLDPSPAVADVVAAYVRYYSARADAPATDPGFWTEVQSARKAGAIGNLDVLGRLIDMFAIAERVLGAHIDAGLRSLAEASTADTGDKFHDAMLAVQQAQARTVVDLEELLRLLEDWNDYQDVVRMTRRLRDAERDLMERIKLESSGKE